LQAGHARLLEASAALRDRGGRSGEVRSRQGKAVAQRRPDRTRVLAPARRRWPRSTSMKCKSINYAEKETVEIIDVEVADPGAGEVQVQGVACGVCAWDVHVFKNGVDRPVPPGHEGVGRVTKLGPG